jgi:hypothetical protein
VTWVESASRSFRARHDAVARDDAERVLHSLEEARERLADYFPTILAGLTVVLHRSGTSLSIARPVVPLAWLATEPAARRYLAGWAGSHELHVLAPDALERRASAAPGSREMLALTAPALYARRVVEESNRDLRRRSPPGRLAAELRWAWMLEGAARWFSGQTEHSSRAIARRLSEGAKPRFPPGIRDALLLGGTVIDLLAREQGEQAAARFVCQLDPRGPRIALAGAFDGRPLARTEQAWRLHLKRRGGPPTPAAD